MCLLAVGRNNNKEFRIEANLNSIFGQNYSNYLAVFMDDNSDDGSDQIYNKYF
jgi:glycosyltransferase involved in cell wall biosynthesis